MRNRLNLINGQEINISDIETVADNAALADDRIFSELFRMTPYNGTSVAKGILPYGTTATVTTPGGGLGIVQIHPFRAFVGTRTTVGDSPELNRDDIRSCIVYSQNLGFSDGDSTYARWDLVCAKFTIDAPTTAVRYVKQSTGTVISEGPTSLTLSTKSTVTMQAVTGTASVAPTIPSVPADSPGIYYIPIALVRIPALFTSSSTIASTDIFEIANVLNLSDTNGAITVKPANSQYKSDGPVLSKPVSGASDWAATGSRPPNYIPPSLQGEDIRYITLNLTALSQSDWSQPDGSVVDDTIDWRNRIFTWQASVSPIGDVPWQFSPSSPAISTFTGYGDGTYGRPFCNSSSAATAIGSGQSFFDDHSFVIGMTSNTSLVCLLGQNNVGGVITGAKVVLYVDRSDGKLKFTSIATSPSCGVFVRLAASSQYGNVF